MHAHFAVLQEARSRAAASTSLSASSFGNSGGVADGSGSGANGGGPLGLLAARRFGSEVTPLLRGRALAVGPVVCTAYSGRSGGRGSGANTTTNGTFE